MASIATIWRVASRKRFHLLPPWPSFLQRKWNEDEKRSRENKNGRDWNARNWNEKKNELNEKKRAPIAAPATTPPALHHNSTQATPTTPAAPLLLTSATATIATADQQ